MKINPNKFVPNGFGVPPEPRREKNLAEQLYDQLDIVLDSLAWFRESGDSAKVADCEDVIREIRARIDELARQARQQETQPAPPASSWKSAIAAGRCPICGLDLAEFPHSEQECAECLAQIRDAERKLSGMHVAANLKACGASAITPQSFAAWAEAEFDRGVCPECGGNLYEVRGTIYCNQCEREVPPGKCPVCGLDLTEHPHGEAECDALLAYEEAGFYDAQAEIAQARIDYRYSSQ